MYNDAAPAPNLPGEYGQQNKAEKRLSLLS